jgi:hypothetical protein
MSSEKLLRHIVLFKFKDEVNREQVNEVGKAFLALLTQIEAIHDLEWGSAINEPNPYTHCLLVTVRTEATLKAYDEHPEHKAIATNYGHLVKAVVVLDYWTKG